MDVTDASQSRIDIAVNEFVAGGSFSYHSVVFCWDKPKVPAKLIVRCYSDWTQLDNIKREEADEKITRAKSVAEDLGGKSSVFKSIWEKAIKRFEFCLDYGNGAILLAEELNGQVIWKGK